jgi:hypothetical protein
VGGIEHCGNSAQQALKMPTAPHRGRASALLHSVCMSRRPMALPAFRLGSNGVQRHRRVRTRRIQVRSARLATSRQDAMWSIGCRFHALLRRDVDWGASAHSTRRGPKNDRPVRGLPLI